MKQGIRFIYVGELIRTPWAPDHLGIIQGLSQLKNEGVISEWKIVDPVLYPDKVVQDCNAFNADLIVHGNTDSLDREWCREIKAPQAFFMGDVQLSKDKYHNWNNWIKNSGQFQGLFISNRDQLGMWSEAFKAPAYFWPHGCYVLDKLEKDDAFKHDLLFIGAMNNGGDYQTRFNLITRLNELYPVDHLTRDDVDGRNQIWRDLSKLYHSSNFVLDVSHFWNIDGYASGRYWYSGGYGACSLTKRFPGCEEFYEDKVHKLYFDTPEEAKELIEFYSKHDDSREKIKIAAYERNKNRHNYKVRFLDMFDKLGIKI
jgi:hypothetical protein